MRQITKQDAIRSQLDTAIWLWFNKTDLIPAHALACAALDPLRDIAEITLGRKNLLSQLPKDKLALSRKPQNFFKHADDDPHDVFDFNEAMTQHHIFDAVILYEQLYRPRTLMMDMFLLRYALLFPSVSKIVDGLPPDFDKAAFAKLQNKEFFTRVLPLIKGN